MSADLSCYPKAAWAPLVSHTPSLYSFPHSIARQPGLCSQTTLSCLLQSVSCCMEFPNTCRPDSSSAFWSVWPPASCLPACLQAFSSYLAALSLEPACVPALLAVGGIYKARGMLMEALQSYQAAYKVKPTDAVSIFLRHGWKDEMYPQIFDAGPAVLSGLHALVHRGLERCVGGAWMKSRVCNSKAAVSICPSLDQARLL